MSNFRTIVAAKARNEGLYIVDWVAWYKMIGFDQILIVSNDNSDGSDNLLNLLKSNSIIDWIDVSDIELENCSNPIGKRSSDAIANYRELSNFDYLFSTDLDEFLYTKNANHISDIYSYLEQYTCLFLSWLNFASGFYPDKTEQMLMDRNPWAWASSQGKLFAEICGLNGFHSGHHVTYNNETKERYRTNGVNATKGRSVYDIAFIAHYRTKSAAEYVYRQDRGDAIVYEMSNRDEKFSYKYNYRRYLLEDTSDNRQHLQFLTNDQRQEYNQHRKSLRSLPGITKAEQEINCNYETFKKNVIDNSFIYQYIKNNVYRDNEIKQYEWAKNLLSTVNNPDHDLILFLADKAYCSKNYKDASYYCDIGIELYNSDLMKKIKHRIEIGRWNRVFNDYKKKCKKIVKKLNA